MWKCVCIKLKKKSAQCERKEKRSEKTALGNAGKKTKTYQKNKHYKNKNCVKRQRLFVAGFS